MARETAIRDDDFPELTDEELASAKPAREMLPAEVYTVLAAAEPKRRPGQRGPGKKPALVSMTIRVEPETLAGLKKIGPRWQAKVRGVLQVTARTGGAGRKP